MDSSALTLIIILILLAIVVCINGGFNKTENFVCRDKIYKPVKLDKRIYDNAEGIYYKNENELVPMVDYKEKSNYNFDLDEQQDFNGPLIKMGNVHYQKHAEPHKMKMSNKKYYTGWKQFYTDNFMKGNVKEDTNFEGTVVRNYLDNLNYFHN